MAASKYKLIKLTALFYELVLEADLTRKTIIELRPNIAGSYKGLIYCKGLDQAKRVKVSLDIDLGNTFQDEVISQIKRGCSEFPLRFPEYGKLTSSSMSYPIEWKPKEDQFDQNNLIKPKENLLPSRTEFCLSDFYIIQKWLDYAKGLGDPSCEAFEDIPIIFHEIYDIALLRKARSSSASE